MHSRCASGRATNKPPSTSKGGKPEGKECSKQTATSNATEEPGFCFRRETKVRMRTDGPLPDSRKEGRHRGVKIRMGKTWGCLRIAANRARDKPFSHPPERPRTVPGASRGPEGQRNSGGIGESGGSHVSFCRPREIGPGRWRPRLVPQRSTCL